MDAQELIERARLRKRVAARALGLHDLHARHARERGDEATAARANERYDRELERSYLEPAA
jgi:hypothetical protein